MHSHTHHVVSMPKIGGKGGGAGHHCTAMATKQRTRRRLPATPSHSDAPKSDEELLKLLPPEILSQLQNSNPETKLYQGLQLATDLQPSYTCST